jgi:propanediol dehydratase large subunit
MSEITREWRRTQLLADRAVNQDGVLAEDPALGLIAFDSPNDPEPAVRVRDGRVVHLDGRDEGDFDLIDRYVAAHGLDLETTEASMAVDEVEVARRIVDFNVPRADVCALARGLTPARLARVMSMLAPVEILQAMQKMRVRRTPSIQAHVTNALDHPLLLAADAASAVAMGFRELETTVPVLRDAPLNAIALLIGSQTPNFGTLTQCSVEERAELELGLRGLTTYVETVSLYGTETVFRDGDDTPWSKALLASAYASRGLKLRVTSGAGAEVLMGEAEGCSLMYLEARCVALARAIGSQGVQNGGIDGINVAAAVPGGMREVLAENLLVMICDLEACTGNDTLMSASDLRRAAHTVPLLLAGSDFLFSGFGSVAAYDNMFGPSNLNAEDLDDYLMIQRDWGFDGVLRHRQDGELLEARRRAARACRDVLAALELIEFDDDEVEQCIYAHDSRDVAPPAPGAVTRAATLADRRGITGADVATTLVAVGEQEIGERVLRMLRLAETGEHLQPAAILDPDGTVRSAVTDPNDYRGPATGHRLGASDRAAIGEVRALWSIEEFAREQAGAALPGRLIDRGIAAPGHDATEVVIAVSPALGRELRVTLSGIDVIAVVWELLAGLEEEGAPARLVRVRDEIDLGAIVTAGAGLSGSGIAIGLLGKGTAILSRAGLPPLANLELFSVAPRITRDLYRGLGANAARHARGAAPAPLAFPASAEAIGPRYHTRVVAMTAIERAAAAGGGAPLELELEMRA